MRKLIIYIILIAAVFGSVILLKTSDFGPGFVSKITGGGSLFLPLVIVAALIDSINPCAFSILLVTIAFLFSIGKLRRNILAIGGTYIFGIFLVYLLIGLGVLRALHLFGVPNFMGMIGAVFLVIFGLINVFEVLIPKFPSILKIPHSAHGKMAKYIENASLPTAFALGALVGICEFPCTGGPYLMILGLLHDGATFFKGFNYLLLYNLIFVLPLVIILMIASNENILVKVEAWQKAERKKERLMAGVAMIVLGLIIFLV
jgi:cytochrome c-type biogenesis protein